MSDVIDQGCRFETQFREMALARVRAPRVPVPQRESATECEECGEAIPEKRRENIPGCRYCTPCQERVDKERR